MGGGSLRSDPRARRGSAGSTRRVAVAAVVLAAAIALGVTAASPAASGGGSGDEATAAAAAANADASSSRKAARRRAPRVKLSLPLAAIEVRRHRGRQILTARVRGRGAVDWVRPNRRRERLGARRVATVWAGVQAHRRARVRLGKARLTLRRPRIKQGRLRAVVVKRRARPPRSGRLRATIRHHDRRRLGRGCPLAPFVSCPGRGKMLADLHRADLRGADLRAANLHAAFAHRAALAGADLRGADLRAATLTGADLRGARLRGAHLADANLRRARVRNRQLRRAHLCQTKLRNGRISERDCGDRPPRLQRPDRARPSPRAATAAAAPDLGLQSAPLLSPRERIRALPARFVRRPRGGGKVRVRVRVQGPGTVTGKGTKLDCPGRCQVRLRKGKQVQLFASPDPGARFERWSGACRRAGKCKLKLRRNARVVARFAPTPKPPTPPTPPTPPPPPPKCPYAPTQDSDNDQLFDCTELAGWTIHVTTPQVLAGSQSAVERQVSSVVGRRDTDGDGLIDGVEFQSNGDPRDEDTDNDGIDDGIELNTYSSNISDADSDNDSLPSNGGPRDPRLFDGGEVNATPQTSPRNPDTDGDSLGDFYEIVIGGTNPAVANLPDLGLVASPGSAKVQIDLPYTVTQTTGTENQSITATQTSQSQQTSTSTSQQTTHTVSQEHQVGGSCNYNSLKGWGCSVSYQYTNTQTDSTTHGSEWGFANTQETTQQNQQLAQLSAERQVSFDETGCLQVFLELENTGSAAVSAAGLQVLATISDSNSDGGSKPLATLLPVNGEVYVEPCPATDEDFPPVTIPANGTQTVGFSQAVPSDILREYIANPTPIRFQFGAVELTGTNSAGQQVNFSGDVADQVSRQDASITVDFGDGTIRTYQVAAGIKRNDGGGPAGITLKEALGPALADLSPQFSSDPDHPGYLSGLRNPATGEEVVNAANARQGAWNIVGDASGIGEQDVPWQNIVLRPGDQIGLSYSKDADGDGLDDGNELQLGTDPQNADTDGDGLDDFLEVETGWTVPFARGNQQEYSVRSSPLSCDADGDSSPDGPGKGNSTYGACPQSPYPPESQRADTGGDQGLSGTDPTLADTNADGLLDGNQAYPDVLRAVGKGGRVPAYLVQWGGTGGGDGSFTRAVSIAIDHNQPVSNNGEPAPIDSYVVDSNGENANSSVTKFSGNPAQAANGAPPVFQLVATTTDGNFQALGIAVSAQTTGSGADQGSVVDWNSVAHEPSATNQIAIFNGTTGQQISTQDGEQAGTPYSNSVVPAALSLAQGHIDLNPAGQTYVARGVGSSNAATNNGNPNAIPCLLPAWLEGMDVFEPQPCLKTFGSKAAEPTNPKRGELVDPSGIAYHDDSQTLYVGDDVTSDCAQHGTSVTGFDTTTGAVEHYVSSSELCPRGIAVDPSGDYVYVANGPGTGNGADVGVIKLSPSLSVLARWGRPGGDAKAGAGTFNQPADLDVDASHAVWVVDAESNLVQCFFYPFGPD